MYTVLAARYGWTFEQIAAMTQQQQQVACNREESGSDVVSFTTGEEYRRWAAVQRDKRAKS